MYNMCQRLHGGSVTGSLPFFRVEALTAFQHPVPLQRISDHRWKSFLFDLEVGQDVTLRQHLPHEPDWMEGTSIVHCFRLPKVMAVMCVREHWLVFLVCNLWSAHWCGWTI